MHKIFVMLLIFLSFYASSLDFAYYKNKIKKDSLYMEKNILLEKLAISESPNAVAYEDDDFSETLFYLRRGEVIFLGSFPFVYLISQLIYDLSKYIVAQSKKDPNASSYAPFSSTKQYELNEELGVIGVSLGLSLIIAIIDSVLVAKEAKRFKNEGKSYDYFTK